MKETTAIWTATLDKDGNLLLGKTQGAPSLSASNAYYLDLDRDRRLFPHGFIYVDECGSQSNLYSVSKDGAIRYLKERLARRLAGAEERVATYKKGIVNCTRSLSFAEHDTRP